MAAMEVSERAQRVHKEAIVIDMLQSWRPLQSVKAYREEFKKLVNSGFAAIHITVNYIYQDLAAAIPEWAKFLKVFESIEEAKFAFTADDIESAKKEGKCAIIMGMQETLPYERDLDLISIFYKLGLRVAQFAYSRQTLLSSGCGERVDSGLTGLGIEAVEELNRLGILIDVSHCSDKAAIEATKASKAPIAITHSTPHGLVGMPRARSGEAIKAVAEKGGVFGQIFTRPWSERDSKMGVRPTLSGIIDLIDYTVNLVGVDHIGLGIDYTPFFSKNIWDSWLSGTHSKGAVLIHPYKGDFPFEERYPPELEDPNRDVINITEELLRHGYSDDDAKKIMGGNWLRLIKEVWK